MFIAESLTGVHDGHLEGLELGEDPRGPVERGVVDVEDDVPAPVWIALLERKAQGEDEAPIRGMRMLAEKEHCRKGRRFRSYSTGVAAQPPSTHCVRPVTTQSLQPRTS